MARTVQVEIIVKATVTMPDDAPVAETVQTVIENMDYEFVYVDAATDVYLSNTEIMDSNIYDF